MSDEDRWYYTENNPGVPEDGYFLVSPSGRQVGLIDTEQDARSLVEMLNEALEERRRRKARE